MPRTQVVQPSPYTAPRMAPTPVPAPTQPRFGTPPVAQAPVPQATSEQERAVFARVNQVRAQHSLRALRFSSTLFTAARDHSLEQQRHGYMGHGSPDPKRARLGQRMQQAGYQGRVYAEVVAWGYTAPDAVVEGWLNSPDHRRILLDAELTEAAFSRVGQYWTGNFGAPRRWSVQKPKAQARKYTFRRAQAPQPRRATPPAPPQPRPSRPAPAPRTNLFQLQPQPQTQDGFG